MMEWKWKWKWKELMLYMFNHSYTTCSTNCILLNYYACLIFYFLTFSHFSPFFSFFTISLLFVFFFIHNIFLWNIIMTFVFHFQQSNYATFLILAKQCNIIKWRAQMGSKRLYCLGLVFGIKGYEVKVFIILHYTICNKLWQRMQTSSREW